MTVTSSHPDTSHELQSLNISIYMPRHYINPTTIKLYPQMAAHPNRFTLNINLETMLIRDIIFLITETPAKGISPFSPITSHHQDFSSLLSFNTARIYCTLPHLWKVQEDPRTGKFQGQGPTLWWGSRCKQLCNTRDIKSPFYMVGLVFTPTAPWCKPGWYVHHSKSLFMRKERYHIYTV